MAEMTFHYKSGHHDLWAACIMTIIRTPPLRYLVIGLLITIFCLGCTSAYLSAENHAGLQVVGTAALLLLAFVVSWIILRLLITRIGALCHSPGVTDVTTSESGIRLSTAMGEVKYSWDAVTEFVVTSHYAYIFVLGMEGHAFDWTGFESRDLASDFCSQIASFIDRKRVIVVGTVAGDDRREPPAE